MNSAMRGALMPFAKCRIVYDKFHIMQHAKPCH
jgi:hypothetical protein